VRESTNKSIFKRTIAKTVCKGEPGERKSACKRMFKRSIPRTVCKGEPGERICPQKDVQEIHSKNCMQRRTW